MVLAGPARNLAAQEGERPALGTRAPGRLVAARGAEVESRASDTSARRKHHGRPRSSVVSVTSLDRQELGDRVLDLLELDGLGEDDQPIVRPAASP